LVQLVLLAGHLDPRSGLGAVDLGERGLLHLRGRVRIRVGLVRRVRASGGSESGAARWRWRRRRLRPTHMTG